MRGFSASPSLLNKVRGALGRALIEGGSDPVQNRETCDWPEPCTAEILFGKRPKIRIGPNDSEITKPFVLFARPLKHDLEVGITLFGSARNRMPDVRMAMIQSLRKRVRWDQLARDHGLFVPRTMQIPFPVLEQVNGITAGPPPKQLLIQFVSPLDAERGQLDKEPQLIFRRLARRLQMLARWQGVEVATEWRVLEEAWLSVDLRLENVDPYPRSRGGHKHHNTLIHNVEVCVEGNVAPLLPMLLIGEHTHVGRGASLGLGRYRLLWSNAPA